MANTTYAFAKSFDAYAILKIRKDATPEEIKTAYYKLAIQHHPDKGGNVEIFKTISRANEILSDPIAREEYDDYRSTIGSLFRRDEEEAMTMEETALGVFTDTTYNLHSRTTRIFKRTKESVGNWVWGVTEKLLTIHNISPRRPIDEKNNILWITLEDVYFGATFEVRIGDKAPIEVSLRRGVRNGEQIRIGVEIFRVKIQPHITFRRGGNLRIDPGTRPCDIITTIEVPHHSLIESERGTLVTLSGEKILWQGIDAATNSGHIRYKFKGLPESNNNGGGSRGNKRGGGGGKNSFGDLILEVTRQADPLLIK